jgi:hypothetical protein
MEEVICPHCGKSNQLTDRFCHYCMKPLAGVNTSDAENESHEGEVPEWLKRIREMKRIDEEREKDKEKWRQQTLFGQNSDQQKHKINPPEKKAVSPRSGGGKEESPIKSPPPVSQPTGFDMKPSKSIEGPSIQPADQEKKDLPEGFLPFSIDEE